MEFTFSVVFLMIGIIMGILEIRLFIKQQNIAKYNTFKISKHLEAKLSYIEDGRVSLYYNEMLIDYVLGSREGALYWYIVGNEGLYVVNRLKSTYDIYADINAVPQKHENNFKEII